MTMRAPMTTYKVTYERDEGGWWIARVVGVKGVHSNGRTIEEARRRVREALGLAVDDAKNAVLIDKVRLPVGAQALVKEQQEARQRAAKAQVHATQLQRKAVDLLIDKMGLSCRDVGALIGVSGQMVQRISQSGVKA